LKKTFLYKQIYDAILEDIVNGKYNYGDTLPFEKELCEKFSASIITVRRALEELQENKIITKVKGKGSIVTAKIRSAGAPVDKNIGILNLSDSLSPETSYPSVPFKKELYNQNDWKNIIYTEIFNTLSHKFNLILGTYSSDELINNFESTVFANINRIFIAGYYNSKIIEFLQSKGKLIVVYNNFDKNINVCSVISDEREKVRQLVEKLIHFGHTSIAAINGNMQVSESVERFMGYQSAMINNNVALDMEKIKWGNFTAESGYHLTKQLLSAANRPTAIICVNDNVALGCLEAIKDSGLRCPEDISVVGHDCNTALIHYTKPKLTTIDPHFKLIGKKIAEKLVREIWIDDITVVESTIVETRSISAPPKL